VSKSNPNIEAWIVDKRLKGKKIIVDEKNNSLKLFTFEGFKDVLNEINTVVPILHSEFLRELRLGIPSKELGHPEIPNAIRYINSCRTCLDDQIFRFFRPRRGYYAVNGCAGMGKSVLLAYCLYSFSSDVAVEVKNNTCTLLSFSEKSTHLNLPTFDRRKIYAFAVKKKQIDALEGYWQKIKRQITSLNEHFQPGLRPPTFKQWNGEIPIDCNLLVIDEAHDLSLEDQRTIAEWVQEGQRKALKRYLLVACDRNQALQRKDSDENIILGLNFSGHSTRLNRIYRCPFPVYIASIGLLFRWFALEGGGVYLSTQRLREHFGFQPEVAEHDGKTTLSMRNDCHPRYLSR